MDKLNNNDDNLNNNGLNNNNDLNNSNLGNEAFLPGFDNNSIESQSPYSDLYNQNLNVQQSGKSLYGNNISMVENQQSNIPFNNVDNQTPASIQPVVNVPTQESISNVPPTIQPVQPTAQNYQTDNQFDSSVPNYNSNYNQNYNFNNQSNEMNNQLDSYSSNFNTTNPMNNQFTDQVNNYNVNSQPNMTNNFDSQSVDCNYNSSDDYNMAFVRSWMGTLYDKAHSKKFNFCAAILGPAYFMYRKLFGSGILLTLVNVLITVLVLILSFNANTLSAIPSIILGSSILYFILDIVYGFVFYPLYRNFVRNNLNRFKQNIADTNQLISIASKRGGTSILALILYYVLTMVISFIIITVASSLGVASIFNSVAGGSSSNTNTTNSVAQVQTDMKSYTFSAPYEINYDANKWLFDDTTKELVYGAYSLKYANQSVTNIQSQTNIDVKTSDGRASLLKLVISSFTQAIGNNGQIESGNSNFVLKNNLYYVYVDIVSTSSIVRYYLVLLPDKDAVYEFTLSTDDTVIEAAANLAAIDVVTSVKESAVNTSSVSNTVNGNSTISNDANSVGANTNAIVNSVSSNSISNSVQSSNQVGVEVTNQTVTNNGITSSSDLSTLLQ